ncbi:MAG: hypothetical protein EXR71_04695 [Myxococcales bacterium]|nr:hypothetical protein [Myxococcales bacterium]
MSGLLFLLGCDVDGATVVFSGVVVDDPSEVGVPVVGATLTTQNRDGDVVGTTSTDSAGGFEVDVGAGASFFLNVAADGYVTTAFSGVAGVEDFESEAGLPWVAPPSWVADVTAPFAECPTREVPGAVIFGEARADAGVSADPNEWPTFPGVEVGVIAGDGSTLSGCYLDDDGVSTPGLAATGATGVFVVFGAPEGAVNVTFTAVRGNGESGTDVFEYIVTDGGFVPILPAGLAI